VPESGQSGGLTDELQPYVDVAEADEFNRMGELLRSQRPTPRPGLLDRVAAGPEADVPPNLWAWVAFALVAGLLLLGIALLGASGAGPLGG
jgi:hypothetical protein